MVIDRANNGSENSAKGLSLMAKIKAKASNLSPEETREILTPFAFKIDQSLFGISLAVPWRRGIALLIDLLLVAILSGAPGELLAILVAITLFRLGSKKRAAKFGKKPGLRKSALRVIGAFVVFVVLVDTLPDMFSKMDEFNHNVEQAGQSQNKSNEDFQASELGNDNSDNTFIKGTLIIASSLAISQSDCTDYSCWQTLLSDLYSAYAQQSPTVEESNVFIDNLLSKMSEKAVLTVEQEATLATSLSQLALTTNSENTEQQQAISAEPKESLAREESGELAEPKTPVSKTTDNSPVYKGFAWLQGLIEDLGIGFGWAAFYFTMFTAIWHGQTPGKKLLRIRVIQLDGTPLSVWDSFGRYGGYGAGIATGLLGFAQIYWDPNRQAIHDKISATIVINDTELTRQQTSTQDNADESTGESSNESRKISES